jgi:excisionase family DNA binding protein
MADIHDFPAIPGYVSIKQAARMLGISDKAVYRYIELGRLEAVRSVNSFLVPEEAVNRFTLNPPGRVRTHSPAWRTYNSRSKLLTTEIRVSVRPGQQQHLIEKLEMLRKEKRHTFPGTIERYLIKDDEAFTTVKLWLIWKDTEMPNKEMREQHLEAFKADLADVLDWDTIQDSSGEALLYT